MWLPSRVYIKTQSGSKYPFDFFHILTLLFKFGNIFFKLVSSTKAFFHNPRSLKISSFVSKTFTFFPFLLSSKTFSVSSLGETEIGMKAALRAANDNTGFGMVFL